MNIIKKTYNDFLQNYNKRKKKLYSEGLAGYIKYSSGYILIIVLVTVTLLVAVSTDFIIVAQTNIGYMQKFENRLKGSYKARSGFELAKYILQADRAGVSLQSITGRPTDRNADSYNDIWALDFPPIPIEDSDVKIKIRCENSKINLSILANEFVDRTPFYGITQRFFINMGLSMDYADIIIDWVDINEQPHPRGAESNYYRSLNPAYNAKNAGMDSIAELLMVKDMTPEIYYGLGGGNHGQETNLVENNHGIPSLDIDDLGEINDDPESVIDGARTDTRFTSDIEIGREKSRKLSDYFRAYGYRDEFYHDFNKININTASFRVLSALTDYMTDAIVTELIQRRHERPFTSVNQVQDLIPDDNIRDNLLGVRSYIFKIDISVYIKGSEVKTTVYFNRDNNQILYWLEE